MNFEYRTYDDFINYCLGLCKKREYTPNDIEIKSLNQFEIVIKLIMKLESKNIIEVYNNIFECFIRQFSFNPQLGFKNIEYIINRLKQVRDRKINFYYFVTAINTILDIKIQFTDIFIYSNNTNSIFYPDRIKSLIVYEKELKVFTINNIVKNELNHFGIYFIYDRNGIIRYIGKSTSCVIKRSLHSAKERGLRDFSKIEYRYPKTKSDVALYETYYISKYKPDKNSDMVFNDLISVNLPELDVSYCLESDYDNFVKVNYYYYEERVIDTNKFIKLNNCYISSKKNKIFLEENNIVSRQVAYNNAYSRCMQIIKYKGLSTLDDYLVI